MHQNENKIQRLSHRRLTLAIFLRHNGCILFEKTLESIQKVLPELSTLNIQVVLVHMDTAVKAFETFREYGVDELTLISDPSLSLFNWAEFYNGSLIENFGPKVIVKALCSLKEGKKGGWPVGEPLRMPGCLFLLRGKIIERYRYKFAGDDPDWIALAKKVLSQCD